MKPVWISGRGLACALGLDVESSLEKLTLGGVATTTCSLPGLAGGDFPYHAIPYAQNEWNQRARDIVFSVVEQAMAGQSRDITLLVATSSFDIGAEEAGATKRDYVAFNNKLKTWLQWTGSIHVFNTACTSGLNALLSAHAMLNKGDAEEVLVLGMELSNRLTMGGFAALQLLSRDRSKPFGAHRDGLVLGEAVAALRVSTRETSSWKMCGGANVVDGTQPTGASESAVVEMYQRALAASGLTADAIDLIKVQASGSPGNDKVEAQGLHKAFKTIPELISLKAAMGHTMGASGIAEIALLLACLEKRVWPQYADEIDTELGVTLASEPPRSVHRLMATILGFGGSHATVVLERA